MQLTRRQFLRALALLPCLALPDLAQAQGPDKRRKIYLPFISGDGEVAIPDGCSTDPILALVCANGDRLDLITWEAGFELDDPGWRPQVAQFKGGGSYADSQIAEGSTLVAGEYANVTETIPLVARGTSEAKCIQTYRRLQQFIKRASDYWKEPSEYDCVWLEARPAGKGCLTGYARVVKAACVDFANPFGQPFASPQPHSVADGLSLVVEREPLWRAVPPGEMVGPLYNLLRNPDFEDWNSGVADSQPDCWTDLETFWIVGDNSRDSSPKWGRYCLKVHSGNSVQANGAKGVTQTVEGTEDGQEYTVVAWVRNAGVTNGVGRVLVTSLLGQYEVYRESTRHGWELHTFVFTAGVGDVIGVNCEILSTAVGCDGEVFFDSLMLLKGNWEEEALNGTLPYMSSSHIFNHWDTGAGHLNYVDVWEVPGDEDALVRLELVNDTTPADYTNVVEKLGHIYVGQRRTGDVQNFQDYHEPAGVADPTCSNSDYIGVTPTPGWVDVSTHSVVGEGDVADNVGRFRVLARLYDAKATGDPTLEARLAYWIGQAGAGVKYLTGVAQPQRAVWNMVNLTPNAAQIADAKFRSNFPGALSYTVQLRRPSGTGNARLDYMLQLPTDGGILEAEVEPGMEKGVALVCDNTASSSISAQGTKAGYTQRTQLGTDYISGGGFVAFKGDLYAATQDIGAVHGGVWRRHANIWTKVFDVVGAIVALEVYDGKIYGLFDPTGAGNVQLYSSIDGNAWASDGTIPLQFAYSLKSYGGYLWVGVGSALQGFMYTWDGAAIALNYAIPLSGLGNVNSPITQEVYTGKLYVGMDASPGEVYAYSAASGWSLAISTGESEVDSLRTFDGKLYIGTGLANGDIFCFDGSATTQVFFGDANNYRIASLEVRGDVLLAMQTASVAFNSKLWQTRDGITWEQIYDTGTWSVRVLKMVIFEGDVIFSARKPSANFGEIWMLVLDVLYEYSVANYQLGGGQNGGFTAPPRRLPDDERRHRWVVSADRTNGAHVISDEMLIGLGFVPRYLGLLGEG